jgi:hypothetical protein
VAISLMKERSPDPSLRARPDGEDEMKSTLQQDLTQRLSDSVERLQQQADRVQYWAAAISGISQPVPDYEPESTAVARYIKAPRPARKRRRRHAANQNERATNGDTRSGGNDSGSTPASA